MRRVVSSLFFGGGPGFFFCGRHEGRVFKSGRFKCFRVASVARSYFGFRLGAIFAQFQHSR